MRSRIQTEPKTTTLCKFKISRRPGSSLPAPESPDLFASGLAGELKNLGVTDDGVKELLTRFDEEEIVQWVERSEVRIFEGGEEHNRFSDICFGKWI